MTLTMVSLEAPCSGCVILTNLLWETLTELEQDCHGVRVERAVFRDPRQARQHPGAEEGRFPILLLNGRHLSEGRLLTREELSAWLSEAEVGGIYGT